jgi:hypothetical protein
MKKEHFALRLLGALALVFASTTFFSIPTAAAQASPDQSGVPVSMVVTVKGHHGAEGSVSGADVIVTESKARAKVTEWVPLQGDRAGLELFILLDDSRDTSLGTQVEDIRRFITAQPPTTKIGVAYMQEGGTKIVQSLTEDHAKAASALHVSLGNLARTDSPYNALSDLIKQWPAGNDRRGADRREILMISTGVDPVNGDSGPYKYDGYVETAIEAAQRAGVVVFAIGTSGEDVASDHIGAGRNYLSQIAEETGGESYHLQSGSLTSFVPYLDDATQRLNRQYLLTFLAKPGKKAGMQSVKVRTDASHTELASAEKVFVPAAR